MRLVSIIIHLLIFLSDLFGLRVERRVCVCVVESLRVFHVLDLLAVEPVRHIVAQSLPYCTPVFICSDVLNILISEKCLRSRSWSHSFYFLVSFFRQFLQFRGCVDRLLIPVHSEHFCELKLAEFVEFYWLA